MESMLISLCVFNSAMKKLLQINSLLEVWRLKTGAFEVLTMNAIKTAQKGVQASLDNKCWIMEFVHCTMTDTLTKLYEQQLQDVLSGHFHTRWYNTAWYKVYLFSCQIPYQSTDKSCVLSLPAMCSHTITSLAHNYVWLNGLLDKNAESCGGVEDTQNDAVKNI